MQLLLIAMYAGSAAAAAASTILSTGNCEHEAHGTTLKEINFDPSQLPWDSGCISIAQERGHNLYWTGVPQFLHCAAEAYSDSYCKSEVAAKIYGMSGPHCAGSNIELYSFRAYCNKDIN
ncbi:hypothetical protein EJ03DRAFT_327785 [Teratosphaeria nubilosa]|uniref:Uncharacterized protein n=1 Tax=Teratosphaeria nubilosa TaxID=161662 RepID=A0A6G1L9W4_9PEZI|nr:hypothetical protein EJ03DRAFT_327785 [Teratosphaeria nubilosa]